MIHDIRERTTFQNIIVYIEKFSLPSYIQSAMVLAKYGSRNWVYVDDGPFPFWACLPHMEGMGANSSAKLLLGEENGKVDLELQLGTYPKCLHLVRKYDGEEEYKKRLARVMKTKVKIARVDRQGGLDAWDISLLLQRYLAVENPLGLRLFALEGYCNRGVDYPPSIGSVIWTGSGVLQAAEEYVDHSVRWLDGDVRARIYLKSRHILAKMKGRCSSAEIEYAKSLGPMMRFEVVWLAEHLKKANGGVHPTLRDLPVLLRKIIPVFFQGMTTMLPEAVLDDELLDGLWENGVEKELHPAFRVAQRIRKSKGRWSMADYFDMKKNSAFSTALGHRLRADTVDLVRSWRDVVAARDVLDKRVVVLERKLVEAQRALDSAFRRERHREEALWRERHSEKPMKVLFDSGAKSKGTNKLERQVARLARRLQDARDAASKWLGVPHR